MSVIFSAPVRLSTLTRSCAVVDRVGDASVSQRQRHVRGVLPVDLLVVRQATARPTQSTHRTRVRHLRRQLPGRVASVACHRQLRHAIHRQVGTNRPTNSPDRVLFGPNFVTPTCILLTYLLSSTVMSATKRGEVGATRRSLKSRKYLNKTSPILGFRVVQGHRCWYPRKASQQCLLR